jgi:hypothetical protein
MNIAANLVERIEFDLQDSARVGRGKKPKSELIGTVLTKLTEESFDDTHAGKPDGRGVTLGGQGTVEAAAVTTFIEP